MALKDGRGIYNYVYDTLYKRYKINRTRDFEPGWLRAYNAYHKVDNPDLWKTEEGEGWRSETYIDITKQKITSGVNLVNDIFFKNDKVPFELDEMLDDTAMPTGSDYEMEKKMQSQIKEGKWKKPLERVVLSGGIYGDGFARFYIDEREETVFKSTGDNYAEVPELVEYKCVDNISVWDMFWDAEVDDFREAKGVIERRYITQSDLLGMANDESIITKNFNLAKAKHFDAEDQFDESNEPRLRGLSDRTREIEYLECWCDVPTYLINGGKNDGRMTYCFVAVCRGQIIKFSEVQRIDLPYFRFSWEDNLDAPNGIGISHNIGDLQKVVNGGFRAFEDNKKLSGNIMWAGRTSAIKNINDGFVPGRCLELTDDIDSIDEALQVFQIPDVGDSLLSVVNMGLQMSDMASNIPRTSQGQESSNPQTAYEIQQRLERAGKYTGRVIANFDVFLEPIIEMLYHFNMTDPNIPYSIKVPGKIKTSGFSSYETRVLKTQKLMSTMQLFAQDQELHKKFKPDWLIAEIVKSNDINPKLVLKSPEELQADAEWEQQQAQIQAETVRLEQEKVRAEIMKLKAETDKLIIESEDADDEMEIKIAELKLKKEQNEKSKAKS